MPEPTEPDLIRTPDELDRPVVGRTGTGPWPLVAVVAVVAALLAGGYWYLRPAPPDEAAAAVAPVTDPPAPPPVALGGNPFPGDVPPLEMSDAFVRTWVPRLSAHPRVAAWLTTDGLIRNFVTVVANIADGGTPAGRVAVLKPAGAFQVVERGTGLFIDPRSYRRYDELAAGFASLDAAAAAQLYATLKPRIEDASAELGSSGTFDRTLERAIIVLLQTPVPERPLAVEPAGIGYKFADARLDGLNGAQHHLLRMGPDNARLVQRQLRDLAIALGVPASRLPPPS